jgi:hypothetical protein
MRITPTAAVEVFRAFLPPHIIIKVEAQAGIYRDL